MERKFLPRWPKSPDKGPFVSSPPTVIGEKFEHSEEAEGAEHDTPLPVPTVHCWSCPHTLNGPQSKTPFYGLFTANKVTLLCPLPYFSILCLGVAICGGQAMADPSLATCIETSKTGITARGFTQPGKSCRESGLKASQDVCVRAAYLGPWDPQASVGGRWRSVWLLQAETRGKDHTRPPGSISSWVANTGVSPLLHLPWAAEPNKPRQVSACP